MSLRARVATSLALSVLVVSAGCATHRPTHAGTAAASPATGSPGAADASPAPALAFQVDTTGVTCVESGGGTVDLALWETTMIASTPLTVTGARAVGPRVRIVGGLVAPVVGRLPRASGISDWPVGPPGRILRKNLVWRERTPLIGTHLGVQRAVLPFLHLRAQPGGSLRMIRLSYRTDAGQVGAATLTEHLRFSRGRC